MRTWIFQGNPKHFDVDGYLSTRPATFLWLVRQHKDRIGIADRVFVWRSKSKDRDAAVVAEAVVEGAPRSIPDRSDARPYWRSSPHLAASPSPRTRCALPILMRR